jgi:hypothetical protein
MTYDDEDDSYGGYESDEDLDDEYADVNDDDEDNVTISCPYCGAEMYDDAEQCPHCGQYISSEDAPREGKPAWLIVVILLCIAMMLLGIIVGL